MPHRYKVEIGAICQNNGFSISYRWGMYAYGASCNFSGLGASKHADLDFYRGDFGLRPSIAHSGVRNGEEPKSSFVYNGSLIRYNNNTSAAVPTPLCGIESPCPGLSILGKHAFIRHPDSELQPAPSTPSHTRTPKYMTLRPKPLIKPSEILAT